MKKTNINFDEYETEIESLAMQIVTRALSQCDNDKDKAIKLIGESLLEDTIQNHRWINDNDLHLSVIYLHENYYGYEPSYNDERLDKAFNSGGLRSLLKEVAFEGMYSDVREAFGDFKNIMKLATAVKKTPWYKPSITFEDKNTITVIVLFMTMIIGGLVAYDLFKQDLSLGYAGFAFAGITFIGVWISNFIENNLKTNGK